MPKFPHDCILGVAGEYADSLSAYLESPPEFFGLTNLAFQGAEASGKITIDCELNPQPRLYLINLGESGLDRKSTAQDKTVDYFKDVMVALQLTNPVHLIRGVRTPEGLMQELHKNPISLIILDELAQLLNNATRKDSIMGPMLNTLYESNDYQSPIKSGSNPKLTGVHLSFVAASTIDTFQNSFPSRLRDLGLLNRLFIVIGKAERKFSIPKSIPAHIKKRLIDNQVDLMKFINQLSSKGDNGLFKLPIDKEALEIFDKWYLNVENSPLAIRLDTYGHRLMILLTINELNERVTVETVEKVVNLLNYQLEVRKIADPIDYETLPAKVEEKVRRALKDGPLTKRQLERKTNRNRIDTQLWNFVLRNMNKDNEIVIQNEIYALRN